MVKIETDEHINILGRQFVFRKYARNRTIRVYCEGSVGPHIAFEAVMNDSGSVKIKSRGNWRFTLPQYREIYSQIFDRLEESHYDVV